jgi:glycosyltransferase involved in cell wall biosynthesis
MKIVRMRDSGPGGPLAIGAGIFGLARAVPGDTEVIVASYYLTAYAAWLAKRKVRKARLFHVIQGYEPNYFRQKDRPRQWMSYYLARGSYRLPLRKTAVSSWLAERLAADGCRDLAVIPNGVDRAVFRPDPAGRKAAESLIMTVGHRRPNRGYGDFIAALNLLRRKRRDFRVLALGLDRGAETRGDVPFETFTPRDDEELAAAYRSALMFVSCSHEEGFGLTPLEAMSCGTAVVTTDSGGVRAFARDRENCLMAPVGDVPRIAAAMERLLDDEPLRAGLIARGLETAEVLNWAKIGRQYEREFSKE